MHLLFLCNEYPPAPHGGIGSYVQTLARSYVAEGVRVSVLGLYHPSDAGESEDQGVRIFRLARKGPPGLRILINHYRLLAFLRRIHQQDPIDLIEGDEDTATVLGPHPDIPTVLRMHGGHAFFEDAAGRNPRPLQLFLERRAFRNVTHLAAVSHYVADQTRQLLGLGERPVTVIPNCIDVEQFRPRPEIPTEEGLIVFAGTLIEKKGIRQLLQALPAVAARFPEVRLEIYGGDTTDPESGGSFGERLQRELPEAVRTLVRFQGRAARASLPEILARASICCYPSHMEAMPIAWLEGLASGKAVLASILGPGPEVIEDGVDGILVNPKVPEEITAGLLRLLADPELRARLGDNARRRAVRDYSRPDLVRRNLEYYRDVLSPRDGMARREI